MADWTSISNANVEPDAPWISATAFALRDNPIAIAEGATGAPRIKAGGLDSGSVTSTKFNGPSAGSGVRLQLTTAAMRSESEEYPPYHTRDERCASFTALSSGTVTIAFTQDTDATASGTSSEARIVRNGSTMQSWAVAGNESAANRSYNLTISFGDVVGIMHRTTNGGDASVLSNIEVRSSSSNNVIGC